MSRQAFLVLGMHRSGTSAVARLVNLAGAAISQRLMAPQPDNPKGFWESQPITDLHDQVLTQVGLAWDSIERVPNAWFASTEAATFRDALKAHLTTDFPAGESFVLKDPRVCRFVPAWRQVLGELSYRVVAILPARNPLEVAESLQRRNGFSIEKSLLLWLRYTIDAESATRDGPRAVVDYGRLLENWRAELAEANRQIGSTCFAETVFFEEQVDRFLSLDQRHHVASHEALAAADPTGWAADAYAALLTIRGEADAVRIKDATGTLDRVKEALDGAETVMEPFLAGYRTQVQRALESGRALDAIREELDQARGDARQKLDDLQRTLTRAQDEAAQDRTRCLSLEQQLTAARDEATSLAERLKQGDHALAQMRVELRETRSALNSEAQRVRELDRRCGVREAEITRLGAEHANERRSRISLQAEVDAQDASREELRWASDCAERDLLRVAVLGRLGHQQRLAAMGRFRALARLLSDAHVPPSRWMSEPLRSARNLIRLRRPEYRRRLTRLERSGLFDPQYYARQIGAHRANLPARFLLYGDAVGERPHLLFDPEWYRQQNPDLPGGVPLLQHYLATGGSELRSPHPLFDARFYLAQWAPGDVSGISPLSHFLDVGGAAGISPHPLFDAFHYLRQRPDVAAAGVNPLMHYLTATGGDAADPHPLFSNRFYLERNPDVTAGSALEHFVRYGAAEGRSPHPLFDVLHYWHQRPDVRAAGLNALQHFVQFGHSEGTDPHPLFSCGHYEAQFAEPRDRGVNPLVHYLRWGRLDSRNPHPGFDVRRYCEAYPDVASSDMDALIHFVLYGEREGRRKFEEPAPRALPGGERPRAVGAPAEKILSTALGTRLAAMAEAMSSQGEQLRSAVVGPLLEVNRNVAEILRAQASQALSQDVDTIGRQLAGAKAPGKQGRAAAFSRAAAALPPTLERALSRAPGEIGRRPKEHAALLLDAAFNCEQFGDAAVASLIVRIGDMAGTAVGIDDTPRMRPVAEQGTTLIVFGAPLPRARLRPSVLGEAVHRLVASGRSVDLYARAPLSRDDARLWLSHPSLRAVRLVPDSAFTPSDLREWLGAGAKTFEVVHAVGPLSADLMPVASESGHQIVYESSGLNTRHYAREFEVALRASDTLALGRISLEFLRTWSSEDLAIRHADVVLVPDQETASFVSAVYGPGLEPICSGLATGGSSPNAGEPAPDLGAYVQRLISAYGASRVRDLPAAR